MLERSIVVLFSVKALDCAQKPRRETEPIITQQFVTMGKTKSDKRERIRKKRMKTVNCDSVAEQEHWLDLTCNI